MSGTEAERLIVQFTAKEVKLLDQAVEHLNKKPGERATRSSVVRLGALKHATEILGLAEDAVQKATGGGE